MKNVQLKSIKKLYYDKVYVLEGTDVIKTCKEFIISRCWCF